MEDRGFANPMDNTHAVWSCQHELVGSSGNRCILIYHLVSLGYQAEYVINELSGYAALVDEEHRW